MVNMDVYASMGAALELLTASPYHRQHQVGPYLHTEVLPPWRLGQTRFYLDERGVPTALVSWAWLSKQVEQDVLATGRALLDSEWNCGDRLFFNDFIAPYANMRTVMHDLTHNVFPDHMATSLRRNPDGSVRRVNRWIGVNWEKAHERESA